jgi:hypothetical protein
MKRLIVLASLVLPLAAAAGPYDQPYAIVTTDTRPSADPNLRPVIVNRVDGETILSRTPAVVAPGPHQVTVDLPPRKGFKIGTQETFELLASPCMRYYVAAKLANPVGQEWKAVIRSSELIGECAAKFKTDKPPQ